MRAAIVAAAALVVMLAGPETASATPPELGGRLSPVPLIYERQPWVAVTSLATVPVSVTLVAGDGWVLEVGRFTLAPGERRQVAVTAAGPGEVTIAATLTPTAAPEGHEAVALRLETRARHLYWWEELTVPPPVPIVLLILVMGAIGALLLWRRRHDRATG